MKDIIKVILLGLGLASSFQSCNLDREPKDKIRLENSFRSIDDVKQWDNGLYVLLKSSLGGEYVLPQEVQADMLNDCGGQYPRLSNWTARADNGFFDFYRSYYALMLDVNIVLQEAPKVKLKEGEQAQLDVYMGNAHFIRAYFYFNLAIRWGVPYNEATEDLDLCVPLESIPFDMTSTPRATNKEIYGFILSDLNKAEKLLKSVEGKKGSEELTVDVVKALKARVYLYMGKHQEALVEAETLISGNKYPLIPALGAGEVDAAGAENPFIKMWQLDSGEEQIFQPFISKPDELPNVVSLYGADLNSWKEYGAFVKEANINAPGYLPTGTVVDDLFQIEEQKDRRIPAYFEAAYLISKKKSESGAPIMEKAYVVSKFKGNPKYADIQTVAWGGYLPNGIQAPKPFRIAEQYLIASEAAYNLRNNTKAHKYLNELRASRGLDPVTAIGYDLEREIQDERARELAYEGFRLWDLRRWHLGLNGRKRQEKLDKNFFYEKDNPDIVIAPNNYKFVWAFPYNEVTKVNKDIVQNKGW